MRPRALGAVCATCAVAVSASAEAQPQAPLAPRPVSVTGPIQASLASRSTGVGGPIRASFPPLPAIVTGRPPADVMALHRLALFKRHLRLEGRRQSLRGERFGLRERDRLSVELRALSPWQVRAKTRELSRAVRRLRRRIERERRHSAPNVPIPAQLGAIARCESGGDPGAISASGDYRGKYQFDYATWASMGGAGDPAAASESEQDRRAALLYGRSGATPWPVCG